MNPILYLRYVLASALSLGVDMAVFLGAIELGLYAVAAAAIGYCSGVVAHWLISSRAVFVGRLAEAGPERRQQQMMFLASALVGLAVTTAIVGGAAALSIDPRLAKLIAIGVSFQITWLLRQKLVFA